MNLQHIKPWSRPSCYIGRNWYGWYCGLGRHRDSDSLSESNFRVFLNELIQLPTVEVDDSRNGEKHSVNGLCVVRETHDLVGWVEWVAIHESNTSALELADKLLGDLESYPVLSDEDWSNLETEQIENYWKQMPLRWRMDECKRAGASIFAARHEHPTHKIYDWLRDTWR